MKKLFFLNLILVFFLACNKPVKDVVIDNPSDEEITVKFNQTLDLKIPAGEKITVPLKFGKETIQVNGGEVVEIVLDEEYNYVVNPTLSQYYIESLVYTTSRAGMKNYQRDYGNITSMIGSLEVNGDYENIKPDYLIKKAWTFGLDESSDMVQMRTDPVKGYKIVKRIVRESDLLKEFTSQLFDAIMTEEEEVVE